MSRMLNNTVSVIRTATNTVVATVPVGNAPDAVAVTPDGKHAYVASDLSASVSVVDTATNMVVGTTIPVGATPDAVAVTPDGKHAYVANPNSNNVSVIDTASNGVVATVAVGHGPFGVGITPASLVPPVASVG
jgi:YVTN family beta-propeller protein